MAKQYTDMSVEETLDGENSEPRVYELGFHLDPELPTEEVKKAYLKIRELIADKGTIVAEGEPQKIPLAYNIFRQGHSGDANRRDFDSAFFAWIVYDALTEGHAEVLASANANNRIIRFIDLLTTKDAARHSAEMRELSMKMPEREKESEEAIVTELDTALENIVV